MKLFYMLMFFLVIPFGFAQDWIIDGNKVYFEDNNVYISAEPHTTIGSGTVINTIVSKQFTGLVDIAYGFNSETSTPTKPRYLGTSLNYYTCAGDIAFNSTHFMCTITNSTNPQGITYTHHYDGGDIPSKTAWWEVPQWKPLTAFEKIKYNYDNKDTWYIIKDVPVTAGQENKIKFQLNVNGDGKYDIALKRSSLSISQAIQQNEFYILDPWHINGSSTLLDNLILYHTFDDDDVSGTNVLDVHTQTLNGTKDGVNDPAQNESGKYNESVKFDSSNTEEISIPDDSRMSVTSAFDDITFSIWFNKSNSNAQSLFTKGTTSGTREYYLRNDGTATYFVYVNLASATQCIVSGAHSTTNDGEFHHYIGIISGTGGNCTLYLDGVNEGSDTIASFGGDSPSNLMLGSQWSSGQYFDGIIDEFAMWDRVLTSDEIQSLYNGTSGQYPWNGVSTGDTTPPSLTSQQVFNTTNQTAGLGWIANETHNATLWWGTDYTSYSNHQNFTTSVLATNYTITGLTDNTLYYYNITLTDGAGNPSYWGEYNFTTNLTSSITQITLHPLNSSLENIGNFNQSTLLATEYVNLTLYINTTKTISSYYLNYTAGGSGACATGNKQSLLCYNYTNAQPNKWIQYINNTNTNTFDGTTGNQGDSINLYENNKYITYIIDEHYNPNIIKHYEALYNFSDVKYQTGNSQRITKNNEICIDINSKTELDQYKFDLRVQVTGTPTQPLELWVSNQTCNTTTGGQLIGLKTASELQDNGEKFRIIPTKEQIEDINEIQSFILRTDEPNPTKYYALKTYLHTAPGYIPNWFYSTDSGASFTRSSDGYETEANINSFSSSPNPTTFNYLLGVTFTDNTTLNYEGNFTWNINATQQYPPLSNINEPRDQANVTTPIQFNITISDPNNDPLNGTMTAYRPNGTLYKVIATNLNESNTTFLYNGTLVYEYYVVLEVCDLLSCTNSTKTYNPSLIPDIIPPNLEYTNTFFLTNQSVLVDWLSNESVNVTILYGTDFNNYSGRYDSKDFYIGFNETLTGLTNSTLYYYNLSLFDVAGNPSYWGPFNFTTLDTVIPPNITTTPTNIDLTAFTNRLTVFFITFLWGIFWFFGVGIKSEEGQLRVYSLIFQTFFGIAAGILWIPINILIALPIMAVSAITLLLAYIEK